MKRAFSVFACALILLSCFCCNIYATEALPSYYSAVDKGYVTAPKQQGLSGSCWAFAAISCLESDAIIKGYETNPDFSEAHLVWTTYNTSGIESDPNSDEIAYQKDASPYECSGDIASIVSTLSKGCGINDEREFPFYPEHIEYMGHYSSEDYYKNCGYVLEDSAYLPKDDIKRKEWITEHGGAMVIIYMDLDNYVEINININNDPDSRNEVNHAVAVVGWDDNFSRDNFDIKRLAL